MTTAPVPHTRKLSLSKYNRENPILSKELRSRMRSGRAYILITAYLILLGGLVGMIYLGHAAAELSPGSGISSQSLGKTIFGAVVGLELMMIVFIAPALTAGAISSEREHQTYDLLRTTLLSPRSLVLGKLTSALSFLLLLLAVAFPLQSLAYLSGGVSLEELFIAFLLLIVTAITFSVIGLFISSFIRRTLASTVISYLVVNLVMFGIPVFVYVSIAILSSYIFGSSLGNLSTTQQSILEIVMIVIGWFFVSVNPLATMIASEIILIEQQSLLFMKIPLSNGTNVFVLSPWIGYVIIFFILTAVLLWLSVALVRRVDK